MTTDLLVGIDGSDNSRAALQWALDEAELRGARVRAVLMWSFLGLQGTSMKVGTTEDDARAMLSEAVGAAAGERAGLVDQVVVNDLPVSGLLDQSADCALIVVGAHGRGGMKGLVLGSVSRTVVERSTIPVVVIPPLDRR